MAAHYRDLRVAYSKSMEFHGFGCALFRPMASRDLRPPCCGYFDRNGDWNLIATLTTEPEDAREQGYTPLPYMPKPLSQIDIQWKAKTSMGTEAITLDGSVETPNNIPAGANIHIKYQSKTKFGAVLLTVKPVTLTAYNDERLFVSWLDANRQTLYDLHRPELKQYGMWLVTRTYTAPSCSINAWWKKNGSVTINMKVKAQMLGELGEDVNWQDMANDGDWSHYSGKDNEGVVVFIDGIDMTPFDWKLEGLRQSLPLPMRRNGSRLRSVSRPPGISRNDQSPIEHGRPVQSTPPTIQIRQHHRRDRPMSWATAIDGVEDAVLRDVGLKDSLSRSHSPSSKTLDSFPKSQSGRSPSLRHENRRVS